MSTIYGDTVNQVLDLSVNNPGVFTDFKLRFTDKQVTRVFQLNIFTAKPKSI